jgi:hypothetical protein
MQENREQLLCWSMWAVAYAIVSGVSIAGTSRGSAGRVGWWLENSNGQAQAALDAWRSGVAIVNARALLDAHFSLMDEVRRSA